jgi:hypothetical protein
LNAVDRRAAFGQIATAASVIALAPTAAQADGAVSAATKTKARFVYGGRIADLKSAVASGDFDAVASEKNAFILFNSGAYPTAKDKSSKAKAVEGTNAIFAAIRSKDKSALKSAYDSYVAANSISPIPALSANQGQGFGSEFSYTARTPAG